MTSTAFLALVLGVSFFIIYTVHIYKTDTQILIFRGITMSHVSNQINHFAGDIDSRNRILPMKGDILMNMRIEWGKNDKEVKDILRKLNRLMPSVTFTDIMTTISARNSKATILNQKGSYCVGDPLMVRLDLYNYLGERKKYGGVFLRVRIYSSSLGAGASGHITDYRNGTYLVNFTLFWEGDVKVSILLIHPSEGVSALWTARKRGYDKMDFRGKFLNGASHVYTKCGFVRSTTADLCEYLDERDQEAFYCVKPKRVPCEALVKLQSELTHKSYLTDLEQRLLKRNNIGAEILHPFVDIHVVSCGRKKTMANMNCRVGMTSPSPSGFVWQNQWHPAFCKVLNGSTLDNVYSCLQGKQVFLLGDSTVWQWIEYLSKRVSTLSCFDTQGQRIIQSSVVVDMTKNITMHWRRHGHPFLSFYMHSMKSHTYIARVIDMVEGDRDTVVVISLGQHFRPFPIELFIRRMVNIRGAIQRLLLRSPDTKVIIKAENTREMDDDQELYSNFHGYAQYLATKDIFWHLNVGFIDAWDMAIAFKAHQGHPPEDVVWNQIVMFLTHIC
ncbi:NXPE family member 2-like [Podarcis raffonei]|uniref:NXPE family member 2-like n=1 Tax=Podarcis raffonei TaxID=65483 RepID=UPI00232930CF|nr:NXPE family member 2-like [Podarcis raffonei]